MKAEDIRNYEIRVIKSTKKDANGQIIESDVTQPNEIADDPEGKFAKDRKFYHLQLLASKIGGRRPQKRVITYNVFNSNDQLVQFNDIADAIATKNYIVAANGDLLIQPEAMTIGGAVFEEECGFIYKVMQLNPKTKKLEQMMSYKRDGKGGYIKEGSTRNIVRVFVHEEENEDLRIAAETERARTYIIKANANKSATPTVEESEETTE